MQISTNLKKFSFSIHKHCHLYRMVPIEIHVTFASIVGKKVNVQPKVMSFNALFFS